MRGRAVFFLVGLTAVVAYSIGRRDPPVAKPAVAPVVSQPQPIRAKPVALTSAVENNSSPLGQTTQSVPAPALRPACQESAFDKKRIGEAVLTAAAIAAIIIKTSRDQYYATGHPCAGPDDLMRNGRACRTRSAYSRPGGAAPLCYPSDVTSSMIEAYQNTASR